MSILLEGISLVLENRALRHRYPGGSEAIVRDFGRECFCADGHISRLSFLSMHDAQLCLGVLQAAGFAYRPSEPGGDVVLVDQNVGPVQSCIWLEFGRRQELPVCWHAAARPGRVHVPVGWEPGRSPVYEMVPDVPFRRRLRFIKTEDRRDWYQDRRTGEFLCMDRAFVVH